MNELLQVARLGKTVGLKGGLRLYNLSDFPTQFKKGAKFLLENGWKPETEKDRELLVSKGVATSRRY